MAPLVFQLAWRQFQDTLLLAAGHCGWQQKSWWTSLTMGPRPLSPLADAAGMAEQVLLLSLSEQWWLIADVHLACHKLFPEPGWPLNCVWLFRFLLAPLRVLKSQQMSAWESHAHLRAKPQPGLESAPWLQTLIIAKVICGLKSCRKDPQLP